LDYPDCIYRRLPGSDQPRIAANEDLFQFDAVKDSVMIAELSRTLEQRLPLDCMLIAPLGIGGHIDHLITRAAAERLARPLWYYADYPYAGMDPRAAQKAISSAVKDQQFDLSSESLRAWKDAASAYESQISSFWASRADMEKAMDDHAASIFGNRLWQM
jgi:LmbE family N-acetylglucosaminyl deacetylase